MPPAVGAAGQGQPLRNHLFAEGEPVWPRAHLASGPQTASPLGSSGSWDTPLAGEIFAKEANIGRDYFPHD